MNISIMMQAADLILDSLYMDDEALESRYMLALYVNSEGEDMAWSI